MPIAARSAALTSTWLVVAAEGTRVAAEELRCAVQHEVGPEFERTLIHRSREGIIRDNDRTGGVCGAGEARDVDHFQRGIGRRLQVEQVTSRADLPLDG